MLLYLKKKLSNFSRVYSINDNKKKILFLNLFFLIKKINLK